MMVFAFINLVIFVAFGILFYKLIRAIINYLNRH